MDRFSNLFVLTFFQLTFHKEGKGGKATIPSTLRQGERGGLVVEWASNATILDFPSYAQWPSHMPAQSLSDYDFSTYSCCHVYPKT